MKLNPYLEVVFAAVIFFGETLTWNMVVGGLMIITSTILIKRD